MATLTSARIGRLLSPLWPLLLAAIIAGMFADKSIREPSGPDAAGFAIAVCHGMLYPAWTLLHRAGTLKASWAGTIVTLLLLPPVLPGVALLAGVPGRFGGVAGTLVGFLLAGSLVSCMPASSASPLPGEAE